MFAETSIGTQHPARDARDVIAVLINQQVISDDYVLYEQGDTTFLAAEPMWEVSITADDANPWETIATSAATNELPGQPIYGWAAFELASGGLASAPLAESPLVDAPSPGSGVKIAHFFVPGLELRFTDGAVTIRSNNPEHLEKLPGIIAEAPGYTPAPAQGVDVDATDEHYKHAVAAAVEEIETGKLQKVILSRVVDVPFAVNMLDTYLQGRAANTPARSFLLNTGGLEAAGFSPETVAEITADGHASTQPLAGTRALTGDAAHDAELRANLLRDPKEIFEHATSVKLACEELDTVADSNGAWVSEFMVIKPRGSVQHLGSRVDCQLASDKTAWDALRVLFPAITASGIPKAPAYDLISRHEKTPRMLYSGAVIRCAGDGGIDAALVLRTIYQQGGTAWLRAGAGIVQGSRPEREHEETREKLSSVAPYVVAAGE